MQCRLNANRSSLDSELSFTLEFFLVPFLPPFPPFPSPRPLAPSYPAMSALAFKWPIVAYILPNLSAHMRHPSLSFRLPEVQRTT